MNFDLIEFINEGVRLQDNYAESAGEAGPSRLSRVLDTGEEPSSEVVAGALQKFRHAKVIEHMSHLIEELVEARVYVPRKSWKKVERSFNDDPKLREEFIVELYDCLLFFRAILAYAGVSGEEFVEAALKKNTYNAQRPDHNINPGEPTIPHPAQELQGDCPSADV